MSGGLVIFYFIQEAITHSYHLFWCSYCPRTGQWVPLTDLFILMCHILLWNLPFFLAQEDIPGSPYFSVPPALELSILARIPISFFCSFKIRATTHLNLLKFSHWYSNRRGKNQESKCTISANTVHPKAIKCSVPSLLVTVVASIFWASTSRAQHSPIFQVENKVQSS